VSELKDQGNAALAADKVDEAIARYTEAIALDDGNHVLYSNRSFALTKAKKYLEALGDAEKTIELKPDWAKVRPRKKICVFSPLLPTHIHRPYCSMIMKVCHICF
jgi:stress-induced-phosphoprotein 1